MSTTKRLRLGALPKTENIKLTKPVTTIDHRMTNAQLKGCAFAFSGKERMR